MVGGRWSSFGEDFVPSKDSSMASSCVARADHAEELLRPRAKFMIKV